MRIVICLVLLLTITFAHAEIFPGFFSIDVENDAGFTDSSYSNGLRMNLGNAFTPFLEKYLDLFDNFLDRTNPIRQDLMYIAANMYTPKEINKSNTNPVLDDRPYAGWSRLGCSVVGIGSSWIEAFDISIGALGDGGNGAIQTIWHTLFNIHTFDGWQNHIKERIAFQLSYDSMGKCFNFPWWFDKDINAIDAWLRLKLDVGNVFIRFSPSFITTFGFFRDPYYWTKDPKKIPEDKWGIEFRLFGVIKGNFTAYNGTLDAQTDVAYKISNLPLTADARGGASLNIFHPIPVLPSLYLEWSINIEMTDYTLNYYFENNNFWHRFWKIYVEFYSSNTGPHSPGNDGRQLD